jgi:hypothetical protein
MVVCRRWPAARLDLVWFGQVVDDGLVAWWVAVVGANGEEDERLATQSEERVWEIV